MRGQSFSNQEFKLLKFFLFAVNENEPFCDYNKGWIRFCPEININD